MEAPAQPTAEVVPEAEPTPLMEQSVPTRDTPPIVEKRVEDPKITSAPEAPRSVSPFKAMEAGGTSSRQDLPAPLKEHVSNS